jgi:hypothetical protein
MPEPEANPAIAEIRPRPFGIFEIRQCLPSPDIGKVGAALRFDENCAILHEAETAGKIEDFSLRDIWIEVIDRPSVDGGLEANVFAYRYDLAAHRNLCAVSLSRAAFCNLTSFVALRLSEANEDTTLIAHCLSRDPTPDPRTGAVLATLSAAGAFGSELRSNTHPIL